MSHFYDKDCNPCHTVIGKNGKERATRITDARKEGWYPSVTTVLGMMAKPSLDRWKSRQITDACYKNPSIQNGQYIATPEKYAEDMIEAAFQQVDDAADLGTLIHDAIEQGYSGKESKDIVEIGESMVPVKDIVQSVYTWQAEVGIEVDEAELRLVNTEYGYAGTTDISFTKGIQKGILDYKTRRFDDTKMKPYDEHPAQIAAYYMAVYGSIPDDAIGCNLYISTTTPGLIHPIWYDAGTLKQEWQIFENILEVWQIRKNHKIGTKYQ